MQSFLQKSVDYSRQSNASESRLNFELPRIGKGQIQDQSDAIALRYHWLSVPKDYTFISNQEIESEYNQLRRELIVLNEQAARNVERISIKSVKRLKKTIDLGKLCQLGDKQSQINVNTIMRLKIQLQQLQKRITMIQQTGKDDIEDSIRETKQQINYLRHKNRELQQKSKLIGSNIQTSDDIFNEIKRLQVQFAISEKKRVKMDNKLKQTLQNLKKVKNNLGQLNQQASQAQNFIQQQIETSRADQAERKLQYQYHQRIYNLQALKKSEQSWNNLKQQKYHQCLKLFDQQSHKIQRIIEAINNAEQKQIQNSAQIKILESKLSIVIEQSKKNVLILEKTSYQKENEKNIRKRELTNHSKILKTEANKKQQKAKMSYTFNNQRLKHNADKKQFYSQTNNLEPKVDRLDLINKKDQIQKIQKIQQQICETIQKQQEYKQTDQKQKDLLLKPQQNESQQNQKTSKESQNQIKQNNFDNQKIQMEDQDLLDFKKSIQAQLNNPFKDLKSIDITLGQIQTTIRQHQTRSRLQNFNSDTIEQQDELFIE